MDVRFREAWRVVTMAACGRTPSFARRYETPDRAEARAERFWSTPLGSEGANSTQSGPRGLTTAASQNRELLTLERPL